MRQLSVTHDGDLPTGEATVVDIACEVVVDPPQSVGIEAECLGVGRAVEVAHRCKTGKPLHVAAYQGSGNRLETGNVESLTARGLRRSVTTAGPCREEETAMNSTRRTARWGALLTVTAMTVAACSGGGGDASPTTTVEGASNTPVTVPTSTGSGTRGSAATGAGTASETRLGLRLSEGTPAVEIADRLAVVEGAPLTDPDVATILERLPEWTIREADVVDFNRPVESLRPPVVGDTLDAPFPPSPAAPSVPDAVAGGPLEVLRFQPEGAVDIAPFIALTFNEPMVELATLEQLDAAEVPVEVTPDISETADIDGRWRWIGTRTLRFEVTPSGDDADGNDGLDRLPAATEYTVKVPVGTASVNGAELAEEVAFTFTTPAVNVIDLAGVSDSTRLDPVFVATFDQRVDADSIVELIDFESGDVDAVRLATDAEIEADADVARRIERSLDGRSIAFVPTDTLEPDTSISIRIGPNLPSLEGPLTNTDPFTASGRTYPPLGVDRTDCFDTCPPFASFEISFNNQLDPAAFDPAWINVEPAVPGLRVDNFGSQLSIRGATAGNTTYTVTISPDVVDVFGQRLGEEFSDEFDVGDARPFLVGPDREFVTTDPFAETPSLSYTTVNHDRLAVRAWQVESAQYGEFREYLDSTYSDTEPTDPDWPVVLDTSVETGGDADALTESIIDLTEAFAESGGPIVVRVEPDPAVSQRSDDYWSNRPISTWVQRADIAADVFVAEDELLVWVTDLLTGEPIADATIDTFGASRAVRASTDAGGIVRIPLDQPIEGLTATIDDRSVMVPSQRFNGWEAQTRFASGRFYVIDDRGIYRPGETVRMTGFVRQLDAVDAQLAFVDGADGVQYTAFDPQGNELATGTADLNALGGFNITIDLPEASNTGSAFVELQVVGGSGSSGNLSFGHEFQIQDFRTPDYEVTARTESPAPYYVVEPATVAVDAEYFGGGPLGDAEVNWFVSASTTSYDPPDWDEFSFGIWTPWWYGDFFYEDEGFIDVGVSEPCFDCGPGFSDPRFQEYIGRTDASGTHLLQIDFDDIPTSSDPGAEPEPVDQPTSVTAEATVFDVNRQAISSRTALVVHPARYYVGLRSDRGFVEQGEPIVIDTTVVDVDGVVVAGRDVTVTAGRQDHTFEDGRYVEELVEVQTCTVTSTDIVTNELIDESMRCEFTTEVGGQYEITAVVTDDDGRTNRAVYTQWVSGSTARPTRDLTQGEVVIVPDAEFHAPGDSAELLVQAPFAPASGLVTVTHAGIDTVEAFDAADGSAVSRCRSPTTTSRR